MSKKIITLFFVLLFPSLVFAQGPLEGFLPSSVAERVQERTEEARTRQEQRATERESAFDDVGNRVNERVPNEAKEAIVGIAKNANRANRNFVGGFLQGLEAISKPFDGIKNMVNTVESNLGLELEKTKEKIKEGEEKIDEVLEEAEEYYGTDYLPEQETELMSGMRRMIQNITENRIRLQERRREVLQMMRRIMNTFGEEMRDRIQDRANEDNDDDNDDDGSPIVLDYSMQTQERRSKALFLLDFF